MVLIVAVALGALAWWSSGRVTGRAPSSDARGKLEGEALKHANPGGNVPGVYGAGGTGGS